ncbi:alpha/beta hydrolase family protein [Streptomyces sp. NBC_01304]|uniref:alpha/beta hydrolase family protein n=1 Tax=Streptomyces sp. NBC_01304 TaxID=2903818 RepID=UPI002E145CFA|nr:alpha/beta hydrolase [Streptomyces sp. NBC_01304]
MIRTRNTAAAAALVALSLSLPLAAAPTAFAAPSAASVTSVTSWPSAAARALGADPQGMQLELPRPTGPYATGRDTLHLTDTGRQDPWVPAAGDRELMLSLYYPARRGGGSGAPYMTSEEARLLAEAQGRNVPAELVSATRTHAVPGARPAPGRHPLIVLSPGFSVGRATLTSLAEDLASRGYVVATVDHAYESVGTLFPGGRMLTCAACKQKYEDVVKVRAKDLSFVLDELTGHRSAWRHARMIDRKRIGMAGHSIGGAGTAATMAADRRVRAGVNLDGTFFAPVPDSGLGGRPFLMLGTESFHSPGSVDDWDGDWARLDGWKRWLTVTGSGHYTFTDLPVLAGQLGMTDPKVPLPGDRSGQITRDYVGAFFDQHLRGIPQPLLDGPTPGNPEVVFRNP